MSDDALWYEIEGIKKWIRRRRVLSTVKYTIYACLIIGIIVYFFLLYNAAQSIHVVMYRSPNFERMGLMAYRVTVYPNIMNPTNTAFEIKNLYVKVFINDYYVSELYKPYIKVNPGQNLETFTFSLNLRDLPEIIKETVSQDGILRIRFSGIATIPLKAFGIIPWHELTIPLDILPEQKFQISLEDIGSLRISDIQVKYSNIESEINRLRSRITDIEDSVAQLINQIGDLSNKIPDVQSILGELDRLKSDLENVRTYLHSIPKMYQLRIIKIDQPYVIKSGSTINIRMAIEYTFSEKTDIYIAIIETEQFTVVASIKDTLLGSGVKIYEFSVLLPTKLGIWRADVYASYYRDEYLISSDYKTITIMLTA
jgi:hypothetical protein